MSPLNLGKVQAKNRIVVAPHNPVMACDGYASDDYVAYQVEKIKGGAGIIIMSSGVIDPKAPMIRSGFALNMWEKKNIPQLRRIAEAAREHDCRAVFQILSVIIGAGGPEWGSYTLNDHLPAHMSLGEIKRMHSNYAASAELLAEAGFAGIELHGHGDLCSDFLSPTINTRDDIYGGARENRVRFVLEAIDAIRARVDNALLVGIRLSADDGLPGSVDVAEGAQLAALLAENADYLNIDFKREMQFVSDMVAPMYAKNGHQRYVAAAAKQRVPNIPVICVGRITTPELAEDILQAGEADMVAMARALIADPEFPNKVAERRPQDIRTCLGDNQECLGRIMQGMPIRCTINPSAGREGELGIGTLQPTALAKSVLVVGGGPAGMEAARTASMRGHRVTLVDSGNRLGGQVLLARKLPGRSDIGNIVEWLPRQLEKLGVEVILDTIVTKDFIAQRSPGTLVLATGCQWLKTGFNTFDYTNVEGWDAGRVLSLTEAIERAATISGKVFVYDQHGFVQGPGIAEMLSANGNDVTILSPYETLGTPALDFTAQREFIMRRLKPAGIRIMTRSMLRAVRGSTIVIEDGVTNALTEVEDVAVVVIVGVRKSDNSFSDLGDDVAPEVHRIGDCVFPHDIGSAIAEGHRVGRLVI